MSSNDPMNRPNIPDPIPFRSPSVSVPSTTCSSNSEQHHHLVQSVDEYNKKSRIIETLQLALHLITADHEAELMQQIAPMQRQIDELTLLASNGTIADWIGDVFKFFCVETINKARKNNKQRNDANFASANDLLAALNYNDDDLEEDDYDDYEVKAIKQQRNKEKTTALRIVNDVLFMNPGTLVELDGVRNGHNGLQHFIDSKRFKDQAYMAQQLTAFHLKVEAWGKEHNEVEKAQNIIQWSQRAFEYRFERKVAAEIVINTLAGT